MLTAKQLSILHRALLQSFPDRRKFNRFLADRLDVQLDRIVGSSPLSEMVFEIVHHAESAGWAHDLVRASYEAFPGNLQLGALYTELGMGPAIEIEDASRGKPQTVTEFEGLLNAPSWQEQLARVERRVCRVELSGAASGTGFLIGPDTVLTAHHVVAGLVRGELPTTVIQLRFDYRRLSTGTPIVGTTVALHPTDWAIAVSSAPDPISTWVSSSDSIVDQLDFALLRLARRIGDEIPEASEAPRGWLKLPSAPPTIGPGDPLIILHHPLGDALQLSMNRQAVIDLDKSGALLRYRLDTQPGSAGAPCFGAGWDLVAMHCARVMDIGIGISLTVVREHLQRAAKLALLESE